MSNNAEQPKVVPEDDDEPDDWYLNRLKTCGLVGKAKAVAGTSASTAQAAMVSRIKLFSSSIEC
jgi:hypothetical protein